MQIYYAIAPLIVAGIIAAVGSIIGSIAKNKGQANANAQQMQYNDMVYGRQRSDALADYAMQNDYNSPTSQMARLRQAGINPMYAAGNLSTQTATVRSSDYPSYTPRAMDYSDAIEGTAQAASNTLMGYYDVQQKEAGIDNLKAQNTVILEEALLKRTQRMALEHQIPNTDTAGEAARFDLGQKQRLADTNAEARAEELRQLKIQNQVTLDRNEREAAMNSSNLQQAVETIANKRVERLKMYADMAKTNAEKFKIQSEIKEIEQRASNLKTEGVIKELDADLKRKGVQPHDNMFLRYVGKMADYLVPWNTDGKGGIIDRAVDSTKKWLRGKNLQMPR